jgi:hypothetical protein
MPGNLDLDGFFDKIDKEMEKVRKDIDKHIGSADDTADATIQAAKAAAIPVSAEEFRAQVRQVAKAQEQERLYRENPLLQELHRLEQLLKLNRESQNEALREAEEQVAKSKKMIRSQWWLIGCLHVAFILAWIITVSVYS